MSSSSTTPKVEDITPDTTQNNQSSTSDPLVRCRKCGQKETEDNRYKKCSRCKFAKYCSKDCQLADWPLHQLMCNPNKLADIQAAEHNEALALAATQAAETTKPSETDKGTVVESKTNEAANSRASLLADIEAKMPPYIPATEQPDDVLVEGIFERLQLMLHPFAVGQYRKEKKKGMLMLQTMNDFNDFRYTKRKDTTGKALDRSFTVHYVTWDEFSNDVIASHPNRDLKKTSMKKSIKKAIDEQDVDTQVVVIGIFGCGQIHLTTMKLSPMNVIRQELKKQPEVYVKQTELQLFLDRD